MHNPASVLKPALAEFYFLTFLLGDTVTTRRRAGTAQPRPSPTTLLQAQLLVAKAKKQQKKEKKEKKEKKATKVSKVKRGKENRDIQATGKGKTIHLS